MTREEGSLVGFEWFETFPVACRGKDKGCDSCGTETEQGYLEMECDAWLCPGCFANLPYPEDAQPADLPLSAEGESVYTQSQILAALTLKPCHTTGEHDPTHTPTGICDKQLREALLNLLKMLGVSAKDLPRALHEEGSCYWCYTKEHALLVAWTKREGGW